MDQIRRQASCAGFKNFLSLSLTTVSSIRMMRMTEISKIHTITYSSKQNSFKHMVVLYNLCQKLISFKEMQRGF